MNVAVVKVLIKEALFLNLPGRVSGVGEHISEAEVNREKRKIFSWKYGLAQWIEQDLLRVCFDTCSGHVR